MTPKTIASALAIFALMFSLGYVATSKATSYAYDQGASVIRLAITTLDPGLQPFLPPPPMLDRATGGLASKIVSKPSCELEAQAVVAAQRAYNLTYRNANIPQEARNAIDATLGAARKVLAECQRRAAASR